jgi:hypothetical protein
MAMHWNDTWERRAREAAKPHLAKVAKARRSLARLDQTALEAIAEAAIGLLDEMRDPDEDHCLAGDDGCGAFWGGQRGGMLWGSDWEGDADIGLVGDYGEDQRDILGPFGVSFRVD